MYGKENNMKEPSKEPFISVYSVYGQLEAEMICAFLESFEIEAKISQESVGVTYGLVIGPLGTADILVPESQVVRAKEALTQMEKGTLQDNNGTLEENAGNEEVDGEQKNE
jgi:hypothetical protein